MAWLLLGSQHVPALTVAKDLGFSGVACIGRHAPAHCYLRISFHWQRMESAEVLAGGSADST